MYEYKMDESVLTFETMKSAFYPTETSGILIDACKSNIKAPGKTLDLGCGIGITGLVMARLGLKEQVKESDSMETIEPWDSFGQISILTAIDKELQGKAAKIQDLAKGTSVKQIFEILTREGLL